MAQHAAELAELAARAESSAAAFRSRATELRAELHASYNDLVGRCTVAPVAEGAGVGAAPSSATDAFDIQLAQCDDEDTLAALENAEEHLKIGQHGKALSGYLTFVRNQLAFPTTASHLPVPLSRSSTAPPTPDRAPPTVGSDATLIATPVFASAHSPPVVLLAEPRRPHSGRGASLGMASREGSDLGSLDGVLRPTTPMALTTITSASATDFDSLKLLAPPGSTAPPQTPTPTQDDDGDDGSGSCSNHLPQLRVRSRTHSGRRVVDHSGTLFTSEAGSDGGGGGDGEGPGAVVADSGYPAGSLGMAWQILPATSSNAFETLVS
jgi:hypothetical protein